MIKLIKSRWVELATFAFASALIAFLPIVMVNYVQATLIAFSLGSCLYMGLVVKVFAPLDQTALTENGGFNFCRCSEDLIRVLGSEV